VKDRADPEDVDHVTLLYVPSDKEITEEVASKAAAAARDALKKFELGPVKARLQGWGYFDGAEKGEERSTALVALLDAPGLAEVHLVLKAALTEAGLPADEQTHGFVPHATLAYLEAGERIENLPELGDEIVINELELVHSETYRIPIGGKVEKSDPRSDTPWDPSHLEDRASEQLVARHWDLHLEFRQPGRPTSALVNEHARIVDELFGRGVKHPAPPDNGLDDLSEDFEEYESKQPDWTRPMRPKILDDLEKRVDPNPGVFASPGGKARIAEALVKMLPSHSTYVEPFAGGAAVLFKKEPCDVEVLNDLDESIVQAYKDVKAITNAELEQLRGKDWVGKRATFRRLHKSQPSNRVERLYKFLYVSFFSYGSTRGKGYNPVRDGRNPVDTILGRIERGRKRLKGVRLMCGDYAATIKAHDSKGTVFFLDPPYAGYCADLGEGKFDEEKFVETLKNLKGKFVLTYGARSKLMSKLRAAGFKIKRIAIPRTGLGLTSRDEKGERRTDLTTLVVSNFETTKKAAAGEEFLVDVTDGEIVELEKRLDPEAPRRFTVHRHWRGGESHVDLRIEKGNLLEGWSLEQNPTNAEPVETLAAAQEIGGDWFQREETAAVRKDLHPLKWLDVEGVTKRGEGGQDPIGGNSEFPGVFHIVEKGLAEIGAVKPWLREFWLHGELGRCRLILKQVAFPIVKARHSRSRCMFEGCKRAPEVDVLWADGRGRAWFCEEHLEAWKQGFKDRGVEGYLEIVGEKKVTTGEVPEKWADVHKGVDVVVVTKEIPPSEIGSRWIATRPENPMPYVLGLDAVEKGWIPPTGISALPAGVRKQIPEAFRYWEKENALETRDRLVEEIQDGKIKVNLTKRIDMVEAQLEVPIQKVDTDKRLVTGVVLEPDEVDAQGDTIDEEAIERAAHNFLARYNKETEIGNLHKIFGQNGLELVESWIAPVDMKLGKGKVKRGTWLMTIRVLNDHTWQQVKTGEITGLSIGGTASVI